MTALELIQETVDFYSADTSRRSMDGEGCVYLADNGNKCAVGRCMTDEAAKEYAKDIGTASNFIDLDSLLLPQYQGHKVQLWQELQTFHDTGYNWGAQGITSQGKKQAQGILTRYKD